MTAGTPGKEAGEPWVTEERAMEGRVTAGSPGREGGGWPEGPAKAAPGWEEEDKEELATAAPVTGEEDT